MTYAHQQGDVQLFVVDSIPEDAVEIPPGQHKGVLAEGETTGHAHRMMEPVRMFQAPGVMDVFMSVPKRIELRHEEHDTQVVEPGSYRAGRIQEFDYATLEARNVQD